MEGWDEDGPEQPRYSGFEPDPEYIEPCSNPGHAPPSHLYIPTGQRYRHICPSCGAQTILRGSSVRM